MEIINQTLASSPLHGEAGNDVRDGVPNPAFHLGKSKADPLVMLGALPAARPATDPVPDLQLLYR